MTKEDLIAFEMEVAQAWEAGKISGPVHLSGGNEDALIEIFRGIPKTAWVFSTWRNHYHALLHGVPREKVMQRILDGRSMAMNFPEHNFYTSAIVAGCLPIAAGVAATGKEVWCFIGDMAARTGIMHEVSSYPCPFLHIVVEDNGLSTDSPTENVWQSHQTFDFGTHVYQYTRAFPHVGTGRRVSFV